MRTVKALIDGTWHNGIEATPQLRRRLRNGSGGFHHRIGTERPAAFPAEPGRYHLYVSYACPWAHRTILYRKLKGLERVVPMSVLHPRWAANGWRFEDGPMSTEDHAGGRQFLHEVYQAADADYTGRVTVPVLWDRKTATIVNNESGDIIRMLNGAFDRWGDASVDFYPELLRDDIDAMNAWLIPGVCQGVYAAGFASDQQSYDRAVRSLFEHLEELEKRLSRQPYLLGNRVTECDWHLFATLCRFDAVYVGALRCNLRRLIDYPALTDHTRRLHRMPGVAQTVRLDHVRQHYYDSIDLVNPSIIPAGPAVDFTDAATAATPAVANRRKRTAGASADQFVDEVIDLHRYLDGWLKGRVDDGGRGPARLEQALADDFVVVHPDGRRDDRAAVIRRFSAAYGTKPAEYALEIAEPSAVLLADDLCLVSYTESHRGEPGRARVSSALLRRRSGRRPVEWLFLQETLVAA